MRRLWIGLMAALLFPYVLTLALGGVRGMERREIAGGQKRIYLENGTQGYVDGEEFLIGVVARQIPADYELEALKAQAIIARTGLYRRMDGADEIRAEELTLPYLEEPDLETLWGEDHFLEYYERIRTAVEETAGLAAVYDGRLIEPLFHRASAGRTRDGGELHPYLQAVDSEDDVGIDGYISMIELDEVGIKNTIGWENGEESGKDIINSIQIVSKDDSGYVEEVQIGSHVYTGDEARELLGLPSSAFTVREYEGKLQIICKGIGHGLGMSQYGAECLAEKGWSAEEILGYYYQDVEIILFQS